MKTIAIMVFLVSLSCSNSFSQTVEGENFKVWVIDKNCQCGFYISYFSNYLCNDHPNPWIPSMRDFNFKFGIPDSSKIKISIHSNDGSDTIVTSDAVLGKGCYYIDWISLNHSRMNSGIYLFSLEAEPYSESIASYKGTKRIFISK